MRPNLSVILPLSTGEGKRPRFDSKLFPIAAPSVEIVLATTLVAAAVEVVLGAAAVVVVVPVVVFGAGLGAAFAIAA